uniref:Lipocalin-15-like n=3 Tax=Dromaius novaehollandiae TaxID=8790 RepID=A0A8C4J574_DRONO
MVGSRSRMVSSRSPVVGGRSLWWVAGPHNRQHIPMAFLSSTGDGSSQFAGTWHIMAAVSNCPVFLSMKDRMKSSITDFSFTAEGNLIMKAVFPVADECKKVEMLFQKNAQAGHYTNTAEGKQDLRVMETDYDHYAIMYAVKERDKETRITLQLYTRGQDVSPQLLKKFKELYPTMGLTEDMLVVMPKSDECTQAASS